MIKNAAHLNSIIARKTQKIVEPWAMNYWHSTPFTDKPLADEQTYRDLWQAERINQYPEIDEVEKKAGFKIDQEFFHDLALHTQITIKKTAPCYQHGRILYATLREYIARSDNKNLTIVETGTARGFSSTIMAAALAESETSGKILTLDLLPHNKPIYWNCIDDHKAVKTRAELLSPWKNLVEQYSVFIEGDVKSSLQRLGIGRAHFAFLDAGHEYDDVYFEFKTVAKSQKKGDIIVFDDYNALQFPGIIKAVDDGCDIYKYTKRIIHGRDGRNYVIAEKNG